jgi:hypothetical protein
MKTVRSAFLSKVIALITGIVFLNMSFFLSEIRILKLDVTHYKLVENIVKMFSSTGFEEEKDSLGESAPGQQVVDLHMIVHPESFYSTILLTSDLHAADQARLFSVSARETATPPPKES